MSDIHSSAVVHPKANLGEGCRVGPYCVVGEHVELGAECHLHSHVVIDGNTRLGRSNELFPFASIGLKTQDLKWQGGVTRTEIGEGNTFRENVTVHSATSDGDATVIGSHNYQQYATRRDSGAYIRLPLAWHLQEDRWVHMNGVFLEPESDYRAAGLLRP